MRNFASILVKFSKLSHIPTTIWRPPKMAPPPPPPPPPPHCRVSGALCYATAYLQKQTHQLLVLILLRRARFSRPQKLTSNNQQPIYLFWHAWEEACSHFLIKLREPFKLNKSWLKKTNDERQRSHLKTFKWTHSVSKAARWAAFTPVCSIQLL